MTNSKEKIMRHQARADASLSERSQLQQALAQLEATLSREENKKVTEKNRNRL